MWAVSAAQVLAPSDPIRQGGFELPDLGSGISAYAYAPAGSAWTFVGSTGLAGNGSGFTFLNPPAPQGDQVAFIQGGPGAVLSQSFEAQAGRYRLTLKAAQRKQGTAVNRQTLSIRVDGIEVAQLSPDDDTYTHIVTNSFLLDNTTHLIELEGKNPLGGDHTVFVDDLRLQRLSAIGSAWSNPATWGGTMPGPATQLVIPAGTTVVLDTDAVVKTLMVHGELYCADQNISLQAEWIMVHGGRLECGSPVSPMEHNFLVTLVGGDDGDNIMGMGDKFLAGMTGAIIELHGEERVSWTQLAATAPAGSTTLTLSEPVDWRIGDQIVLAPTGDDPSEGEVATITAISGGTMITLGTPLEFGHYGLATTYSNNTTTWILDERGEVGLLSRNIKIQGDATSENRGFGAHVMTMEGTSIHTSGVELYRVGQKAKLGRYPFHWHLVQDAPGQYIVNSSVHRSYNRCITVHGTHRTLVADNVCYDFIGHGYFLEDGIEQHNIFDHNLGIWAQKPQPHEAILETDHRSSPASNGPAVFWIAHPDNVYTNNAAAGTEGTGYWYGLLDRVTGPSYSQLPGGMTINPRRSTFGVFDHNRVHSGRQGFSSCTESGGTLGMEPPNEALLSRLTATNVLQAVWPCSNPMLMQNHRFDRLIAANTVNAMQAPNPMTFENSVFISYSDNPPASAEPTSTLDHRAITLYDQGFLLNNVHFVNYDRPAMTVFAPGGGAHKHTNNRADGVSFDNSPNVFLDFYNDSRPENVMHAWGDIVHDLDGSLFRQDWALVSDHPLMFDESCVQPTAINISGYACPYRYGQFRNETFSVAAPATVLRSDGVHDTFSHIERRHMFEYMVHEKYLFSHRYETGMKHERILVEIFNVMPGDSPVIELLDVPATVVVRPPFSAAPTLDALINGPGHRWFWRDHSLFVKMSAAGAIWHASDRADICMTGSCSDLLVHDLGSLPTVTITSPADGARVPLGNIQVNATATDPDGILSTRLYVGTELKGTDTTPPYSFTLTNLAAGSYALKLVAEDTQHRTFTAVQQLRVGDTAPRVEIISPADQQTFTAVTVPALAFNLYNWTPAPGGNHLHWFVNGVDRGHLYSTAPVPITHLGAGRQEIKVALADPDHTIRAVFDLKTIYILEDGFLADYEDGPDSRSSLFPADSFMGQLSTINFAWGAQLSAASRIDGEDDINHFDLWNNNDGVISSATYRLNVDPPQDWSQLSGVEVKFGGPAFQVYVVDRGNGATLLGSSGAPLSTFWLSGLPAAARDRVVALELRFSEAQSPPGDFARQHLWHIRLLP